MFIKLQALNTLKNRTLTYFMKQYNYSPISFGMACYGFGIMPLGLFMLGALPASFLPAVLLNMFLFAGVGQILTGFMFKKLLIKADSILFTLYGFHWATTSMLDFLSLGGILRFKFYSLFSFIAIIAAVALMTPYALKSYLATGLLYIISLISLIFHALAMFQYDVFAPLAGLMYVMSTSLALYVAASELTANLKGYRILPLGRPIFGKTHMNHPMPQADVAE
jgi:succinate-acetate transporter protein